MPSQDKPSVTCYSKDEQAWMQRSQEIRGKSLRPLLRLLVQLQVVPNQLTLLSLLAGVAFAPLFLWGYPVWAFGCLLAHVLLDGLDGPLARHIGCASSRGSFTDTMADQVVVTFTTVALIHAGHAGIWSGALYLFSYSVVVIFAMVRNALAIPYSWLVRPRFLIYAWIPVNMFCWRGSLDMLLWIVNALLTLKLLTGFVQIRRRM